MTPDRFRGLVVYCCVLSLIALLGGGCSGGALYIGANSGGPCATPAQPPAAMGFDAFYTQFVDAGGIPIVASGKVRATALLRACLIVEHIVSARSDVREAMIQNHQSVAVMAVNEVTTDIPEYRDLPSAFPGTNWDADRGIGATRQRPVSSCGEEDLLCTDGDRDPGEMILVQTFAHGVRTLGIDFVDLRFESRLRAAYQAALAQGSWADTFAASNAGQYWAEGMQDWFDANGQASPPDGAHNEINTRAELTSYDAGLSSLLGEYLPNDAFRTSCP